MKLIACGWLALALVGCEQREGEQGTSATAEKQLENQAGRVPGAADAGAPATGSGSEGTAGAAPQADVCAQLASCYRELTRVVCGDERSCAKTFAGENVPRDDTSCRIQLLQVRRQVQEIDPKAGELPQVCSAAPQPELEPQGAEPQRAGGAAEGGGQVPGPAGAGPQGTGDLEQDTSGANEKAQPEPNQ